MATAVSLVNEGNWDLDEYFGSLPDGELPYFLQRIRGRVYSCYPAGMVQFGLPVAALARLAGADFHEREVYDRLDKWTASWLAAWSVGLFFLLALYLVPPEPALALTLILATGSAVGSTVAQTLWQHGGLVFWFLVLLLAEFRRLDRPSWTSTLVQAVACAALVACRLTAVVFLVPFGAWVLLRTPRRAVLLVLLALLAYAPWAALYGSIYGHVLGPSVRQTGADHWSADLAGPLAGVLLSPGRGLLVYQPWVLLGAAACLPAVRRARARLPDARGPAGWVGLCLVVIVLQVLMASAYHFWWGGYCWGSRLLTEVMPLCALVCAGPVAALWASPAGKRTVVAVALLSFLLHLGALHLSADEWNTCTDIDRHVEELWSWHHPPFLHLRLR
jgi:hypothetical protein